MGALLASIVGLIAFGGSLTRGAQWAFRYVYIPALVLVPLSVCLEFKGLPDLTARRAACVGLIAGAVVTGRGRQLVPHRHWLDVAALVAVLSFSISYGLVTDFKGFYHRLFILVMDWACPYLLVRGLMKDRGVVRAALGPLAFCTAVSACLAVYECRMATRLAADLWGILGIDVYTRPHYTSWRWGYLRAVGLWGGPLLLATFFATIASLMALWGLLVKRRHRRKAWLALLASVAGCAAGLSRGPLVVLLGLAVIFPVIGRSGKSVILAAMVIAAVASPLVVEMAREEVTFTQEQMDLYGNVDSGHYRVALLLIYGKSILRVGWWGDPTIVGEEYEQAWSIDNAYLYLFFVGGWIGGGSFCLIIAALFYLGARRIASTAGQERRILAATLASFAAVTGCMLNVWFSPHYAPLFWITAGLVLNAVTARPVGSLQYLPANGRREGFLATGKVT